ncbi:hypothetical protein Tco_0314494, partial [Tanacetum coccineum]
IAYHTCRSNRSPGRMKPILLQKELEPVCICIFDLLDGVPELMHVYFRDFSSDQEYRIAWR